MRGNLQPLRFGVGDVPGRDEIRCRLDNEVVFRLQERIQTAQPGELFLDAGGDRRYEKVGHQGNRCPVGHCHTFDLHDALVRIDLEVQRDAARRRDEIDAHVGLGHGGALLPEGLGERGDESELLCRLEVHDLGTLALPDVDEPLLGEHLDRLADRGAAHVKGLLELRLRWQEVTDLVVLGFDLVLQRVVDPEIPGDTQFHHLNPCTPKLMTTLLYLELRDIVTSRCLDVNSFFAGK